MRIGDADERREPRAARTRTIAAVLAAAVLLAAASAPSTAGDIKAGRGKAQLCQACHGVDGLSKVPDAPNIAGQVEGYLVTQLRAFKSGTRRNEAMTVVVSTLSEQDIENVAAYFAAIEIRIGKLPGE
jgi:cytochrome c553